MILDLNAEKVNYQNLSSAEAKLIVELIDRLKEELEASSSRNNQLVYMSQQIEREQGVVDRLIEAIGRSDMVTESSSGIRMR